MRRAELEAAIRANRDDGAAYDVFADWLLAHGDPLGELIALERRDDPSLGSRILDLRAELVRWPDPPDLSDNAFRNGFDASWRWGLWDRVAISCLSSIRECRDDTPAVAQLGFAHPACAALRELHFDLHDWRFDADVDEPPVLAAADGHAWARELHTLHAGQIDPALGLAAELGRCSGAISRIFPGLRVLALFGDDVELAELELRRLTKLHLFMPGLSEARIAELCAATLPALEHLELDTEELAPAPLVAIATGVFPTLRSLSIHGDTAVDDFARSLASSPIAARLEHLELELTDGTALALDPANLPRLRSLAIRGIESSTRARLVDRFPRASINARSSRYIV